MHCSIKILVVLLVTCIGYVTHDQRVPGSNPVWVATVWTYNSDAELFHQRCGMAVSKRVGYSPGSRFLFVSNLSIAVM